MFFRVCDKLVNRLDILVAFFVRNREDGMGNVEGEACHRAVLREQGYFCS